MVPRVDHSRSQYLLAVHLFLCFLTSPWDSCGSLLTISGHRCHIEKDGQIPVLKRRYRNTKQACACKGDWEPAHHHQLQSMVLPNTKVVLCFSPRGCQASPIPITQVFLKALWLPDTMKGLLPFVSICYGETAISCCTTQLFLQAWHPCSFVLPLTITTVPHKWQPGYQSTARHKQLQLG